jgi:hypothetical protein
VAACEWSARGEQHNAAVIAVLVPTACSLLQTAHIDRHNLWLKVGIAVQYSLSKNAVEVGGLSMARMAVAPVSQHKHPQVLEQQTLPDHHVAAGSMLSKSTHTFQVLMLFCTPCQAHHTCRCSNKVAAGCNPSYVHFKPARSRSKTRFTSSSASYVETRTVLCAFETDVRMECEHLACGAQTAALST